MDNILMFGPPGSGKGTNSIGLSKQFGLKHINTGEKIRDEGVKETKFGLYAKRLIDFGNLVPDEILIPEMRNWIMEDWNDEGLIFDGYPRSVSQSKELDRFLMLRKKPITHFIYLNAPKEVLKDRIINRDEGRADDDPDFFERRWDHFQERKGPILDYFRNDGRFNCLEINTDDSIENVLKDIVKQLKY